MKGHRTR